MVSLDYPPTVGGITAHVYELSQAMIKIGHKLSVVTRTVENATLAYEKIDDVDIYRIQLKFAGMTYGYQINKFIKNLLKDKSFDIIHIHGMRPLEFYNIKDIPLVYTNHTSGYLKRIKKGGYRIPILKRLFNKPDLFLAPSDELLDIPFNIRSKKVFISNGVISNKFTRDEAIRLKIRNDLNIKDNEIVGIVTRRMVWKNGVTDLAKATEFIKNKDFKLLFIGDGEEFNEVKSILEKYFSGRYILLGSKQHHEIISYYSASDISILPSLMEATSISGLEAMAASLPLVGTNVGGIPVLIKNAINGYLCESQNPQDLATKLDLLLSSDYINMGKKSKEMVEENFDWIKIAQTTLNEYKGLIDAK
jgi:glycosyltransferase involved in cell wall biosynthesis